MGGGARTGAHAAGHHHTPRVPASLLALFFLNSASCFSSYIKLSELGQGGPTSRPHPGWDAD